MDQQKTGTDYEALSHLLDELESDQMHFVIQPELIIQQIRKIQDSIKSKIIAIQQVGYWLHKCIINHCHSCNQTIDPNSFNDCSIVQRLVIKIFNTPLTVKNDAKRKLEFLEQNGAKMAQDEKVKLRNFDNLIIKIILSCITGKSSESGMQISGKSNTSVIVRPDRLIKEIQEILNELQRSPRDDEPAYVLDLIEKYNELILLLIPKCI